MTAEPAITFDDVSFSYEGPPVVEHVNLGLPEHDFVCIMGPNGGGKTTLLKLMLGLIQPQRGTVRVLGHPAHYACRRIGYLPQRAQLDPKFPVSVSDVVLMGRLGKGRGIGPYRRADKAVVTRVLRDVGLADLRDRSFSALSGGQRQRVLIARALACEPELLLLDEPTANLDPAVQDDLYALLSDLNQRLTIVIVSHDVGFVSVFFKTVVCVNRIVHTHPTSELTGRRVAELYGREVRILHQSDAPHTGADS